jgi:hypothetical protein
MKEMSQLHYDSFQMQFRKLNLEATLNQQYIRIFGTCDHIDTMLIKAGTDQGEQC